MFVLLVGAGPLGSALEELTDQPVHGSEQSPHTAAVPWRLPQHWKVMLSARVSLGLTKCAGLLGAGPSCLRGTLLPGLAQIRWNSSLLDFHFLPSPLSALTGGSLKALPAHL